MAGRDADSLNRIAPLRKLYHELDLNLVAREVTEMKGLLQDNQIERKVLERLNSANDIFVELESRGCISESNLNLLSDLLETIKRDPLKDKVIKFLETNQPSTSESKALPSRETGGRKTPETSVKTSGTQTQETSEHQAPTITTKTLKEGTIPRLLPLCYPDNYELKRTEGVLEENKKCRGQLVVCEDAIDSLRSTDGPICPVTVSGPARSGKSYIANQLIEPRPQDCVFKLSHECKPETIGTLPRVLPLCYPDNYVWNRTKGVLEEKKKSRGKLVVCEDAIDFLHSIDDQICPVAVIGPSKSGKSYIASQLIEPRQQECVFKTSHTQNPGTIGIWMSTDVFKKTLSNGTEVTVIILDTEGLDAYNAHKEDDMLIFALMALMPSVLVYNSNGHPREEDLIKLSWVKRLIKVFSPSGCDPKKTTLLENEFIKFFPNFIWLLRDVTMSFEISKDGENVKVDFKNYLFEEILKLEKETIMTEAKVKELNAIRRSLLKSFPVFDAMTLPLPSPEVSVLTEMGKGKNHGSLDKGFLKNIDVFIKRCRTLMKPKKAWPYIGYINGKLYAEMLQQYVSGFSATNTINVDAVVQSVIETHLQGAVDETFAEYRCDMDDFAKTALPCHNYEIIEKHSTCLYQAMRKFKENVKYINDADCLAKLRDALKEKLARYSDGDLIGGYLRIILDQNEKMSDEFCRQLVDELFIEILKPENMYRRQLSSGANVDFLNEQYKERARGPKMLHVYKTVLVAKIKDISIRKRRQYLSFEDNANPDTSVSVKLAEEIVVMEKQKNKEQILAMKKGEDELIRHMMFEDIDDQYRQLETDLEEISAALKAKIETLTPTHEAVVKDLRLVLDNMRAGKKWKAEKLTGIQRK